MTDDADTLMRAIRITAPGDPDVLELAETPRPAPGRGELLVRVRAAGVNRADLLQRRGEYPAPPDAPPDVPGLEFAGVVEQAGAGDWHVGDRVMGLVGGGAYAEYVTVDARHVLPVPDGWTFEEAAAVPEAFLTAHDALRQADLRSGERLLVHAVGSGVGTALLQLGRAFGATVAGTSRTPSKLESARELGLDVAVHVRDVFEPPPELEHWADVIAELVGGPYLAGDLLALAPRGRIVLIGLTGGRTAQLDLRAILAKRARIIGTVLRSRSADEKAHVVRAFRDEAWPHVVAGAVRPVLDRVFPLSDAAAAHRYVEENRNFGAVVLSWQD